MVELQIVIAIIGFIPGMVIKISGGSAYYFSDIQHWSALFFMPYYATYFIKHFQGIKLKIINFIALLCLLFAIKNCLYSGVRLLKENFVAKSAIMGKGHYALDYVKMHDLFTNTSIFSDRMLNIKLKENTEFRKLLFLTSLDRLKNKEKRILYIEDDKALLNILPCYKSPLFITSATGMSLLNGLSRGQCYCIDYGFEYYSRGDTISADMNVCRFIHNPIFKEVVSCNVLAQTYTIVPCK